MTTHPTQPDSPLTDQADRLLVRQSISGCQSSFGELVRRYHRGLFHFIARKTARREDAEDITQETFVRAWQKLHQYDQQYCFSTWLYTIGYRLTVSHYRKQKPTIRLGEWAQQIAGNAPSPKQPVETLEESARIWHLADQLLNQDQRDALWLRYADELDIPEIAEIMERTPVNVRVMLHRARQTLAEAATPDPSSDPANRPAASRQTFQTSTTLSIHPSGGLT